VATLAIFARSLPVLLPPLDPPGCRRDRNRHREGGIKVLSQAFSSSSLHSFPKRDENPYLPG
jgi:hypothetical protein